MGLEGIKGKKPSDASCVVSDRDKVKSHTKDTSGDCTSKQKCPTRRVCICLGESCTRLPTSMRLQWPTKVRHISSQFYILTAFHKLDVFVRVSVAVIQHQDQNQCGEGRVYFTSTSLFFIKRRKDRNSSWIGTWSQELMQKLWRCTCLLACSSWFIQSIFLQNPELPAQGWHHPQWAEPYHIIHQSRKCTTALPIRESSGGIFSNEISSFKMTLVGVKLT